MFENVKWLFFDIGSTLIDERVSYEHRMRDIAELSGETYERVFAAAMKFYKQNKKGDLETAKLFNVRLPAWHKEDEIPYADAQKCLEILSEKYKTGVIANQSPGTKERLNRYGILQYIDLVIASAEEGVAKPDKKIFELAFERSGCKPENAVMIGDRIDNDIVPANLLGMNTIWIKQGFGQYWNVTEDIERADYVVNKLTELCDIL